MRLNKPTAAQTVPQGAPKKAPTPPRRWKRWGLVAATVVVVGAAGFGVWSYLRPDPLAEARAALDKRDFRTADELLTKRLAEHPDDRETRLLAARSARRAGDLTRATGHLRAYKEKHGAEPAHDLEARLVRAQSGDAAEADRLFAEYADRPDSPDKPMVLEAYLEGKMRAIAPRGAGRADGETEDAALVVIEAAAPNLYRAVDLWLAARPGRADQIQGRLWRARVHFAANKHPDGAAALREAVALDADHLEARYQLALSMSLTAPDEARRHLEALAASHPDNTFVRFGLAATYRILGRNQDARRLFEGLLTGQHRTTALLELGTLDLDEGNLADAERRLLAAHQSAPNSPEINLALSRYHQLAGRPAEAAKYRKRFEELEAEKKKPRADPR